MLLRAELARQPIVGRDGVVSVELRVVNAGKQAIRVPSPALPWARVAPHNILAFKDGEPIARGDLGVTRPYGGPFAAEQVIPPGESRAGQFSLIGLSSGQYDLVGLVFCDVASKADGKYERVALALPQLHFEVPKGDSGARE